MGRALYRKYRPTTFEDAVGQEHITDTLKRAIKSGKISHAYLFTGPRGIGKTTIARILAHEVNKIPYTDDSIHLDIIEIDAASNRRIDEIRELRDKVHITPTSAKYKVYIIDEVHMLTREAFNALLKTLEEPPAHCIFILATTELHKLPETIISRTQRFSFSPVSTSVAAQLLNDIAKKEKIKITDDALDLIAQHGGGSFRDSISLLDQLSNTEEKITPDTVRDMLGLPPDSATAGLVQSISLGDSGQLLEDLENLSNQGANASFIAKELSEQLRTLLIAGESAPWLIALMRQLLDVSSSTHPRESLEIALLEAAATNTTRDDLTKPAQGVATPAKTPATSKVKENPKPPKMEEKKSHKEKSTVAAEIKSSIMYADFDMKHWPQVLEYAKKHAASLYTALRLAKPVFSDGTLTLYFQFPLHQKKLNQAHQKDIIGQIIEEIASSKVNLDCIVNKEMFKNLEVEQVKVVAEVVEAAAQESASPLKDISSVFGGAEVLAQP
jgi:DNA polymerase-3 subunit gamma/tau